IQLERVAQQRILQNLRETLRSHRPRMVADIWELGGHLGHVPTLQEALEFLGIPLPELLKRGLWSRLLADAGLGEPPADPDEERLGRGLYRLSHLDDAHFIEFLMAHLASPIPAQQPDELNVCRLTMLNLTLWSGDSLGWSLNEAEKKLRANTSALHDLKAI